MEAKKKLLDIVRDKIRFKHYSYSTEKTYVHWIKHYIFFHNKKHPVEMGKSEIEIYLTKLATQDKVSLTIQNKRIAFGFHHIFALATMVSAFSARHVVSEMNKAKVISPLDF
jgi:hypothetical protein